MKYTHILKANSKEMIGYYKEEPMIGVSFEFYFLNNNGHQKLQTSEVREVRGDIFTTISGSNYILKII
jgi:hypothetical protein